jgi:heterotetrameric sarcosine oxidase delta subunit
MSFLIECPHCGPRNIYEFRFGGEVKPRPDENEVTDEEWADYVYLAKNVCGAQDEWWFHTKGCGCWFTVTRDTRTNMPVTREEEKA